MSLRSPVDSPQIRILFLAANPDSTTPLHAGREVRRIRDRLATAIHRSALEIVERWAVRPADLQQALIELKPQIVHFSGHGTTDYELMLEGDDGSPRPVGARVLGGLFRLRGEGVIAVVLSACHSLKQAEAIAEHVGCAIGMRRAIGSEAAIEFSAALYHAIASGDSLSKAFEAARLHLEASGNPEHRTPQIIILRDGADVERSLIRPPEATTTITSVSAGLANDEIAKELSRIARAALLATDDELSRSLYEIEALLALSPSHVEARMLRDRIKRAVERGTMRYSLARPASPVLAAAVAKEALSIPHTPQAAQASILERSPDATTTELIGRDRQLLELTTQRGGAGALICGPAGIGKTSLARALWQAQQSRYPGIKIHIDLQGTTQDPLSAAAAMAHVVRAFLPGVPIPSRVDELSGFYNAVLQGQRALIFLEDARDRAQVEPLLPPSGSALLVTSRERFALPNVHTLWLDPLDPTDAAVILYRLAPRLDGGAANKLARLCGDVPLALRLAAGALRNRPDLTPEAYAERLSEAQRRYEPLDASFHVNFSLLDAILQIVWSRISLYTVAFSEGDIANTGALSGHKELRDLVSYGMLEYEPKTGLYRLPRGGRRVATSYLAEEDRAAARVIPEKVPRGIYYLTPDETRRALDAARRARHRVAEVLYLEHMADNSGDRATGVELLEGALAIYRELGDRAGEARILDKLTFVYERASDAERAVEFGEQALIVLHDLGDRRRESLMLKRVGALHVRLNDRRRAVELYERELSNYRALGLRPMQIPALIRLAWLYEELNDDRRAAELLAELVSIGREEGPSPDLAQWTWRLSVARRRLGEREEAIAALELCVDVVRALGWDAEIISAAFSRTEPGTLEDELAALRAP